MKKRGWSNAIVPILWKNYSWRDNNNNRKNKRLFRTILSFLPTSSKQLLSDNEVKLPSTILSNPPLFNYINFCNFPENIIIKKIKLRH
ncbi:hypothetical protein C1645_840548 [Glomus cerebriforme]|uniref:Uncharacterized protein n=1 Tax=Glomus cerebriforme TaxID=658196 RepID=A0A397RZ91_9GLOM|nr:hypothetical protein C1645_840548 [Glomus cerebriforme]